MVPGRWKMEYNGEDNEKVTPTYSNLAREVLGKEEDINLTLLQLSSVPLIGQTQLEVKEEENSFMQSMDWALRGQSKLRRYREGQME